MSAEIPTPRRRSRLGVWLGGTYFTFAAALFLLTALTTKPSNVGLDWIPFMVVTMPWSGMSLVWAIPGAFLNAAALWLLGTVVQVLVRKARRS